MAYRNKTYVAFDGDSDIHCYRLMQAWKANEHIDFDFYNAHDLNSARDSSEIESIRAQLRERMVNSKQLVLLVGAMTKGSRKFVPWEIDLARQKDIPIIVANLNGKRNYDPDRCPTSVVEGNVYTMHVSFGPKIIQYALDEFALSYYTYKNTRTGNWVYTDSKYKELGL